VMVQERADVLLHVSHSQAESFGDVSFFTLSEQKRPPHELPHLQCLVRFS
jgi:hypothetical protein